MNCLDFRGLTAPEPLLQALAAADALGPGQSVEVLTPLLPTPLLDALAARGLAWRAESAPDGGVRVAIQRPAAADGQALD
ncbi:DUF2249 domain-containing protein [Aerolutibacter ruishenii]|uniref:TusA-related sulfurtransferase n=1 Tax=Aerolutibacter ruishenii TaxID=686800 RepID=A0A562LY07_9GAMM|nr:DUF2249 domain-containing protein [Lysobacter ruishenii]TWI12496.1 TusA-related sulfurtransferase [Lysobacter ruishenii]